MFFRYLGLHVIKSKLKSHLIDDDNLEEDSNIRISMMI